MYHQALKNITKKLMDCKRNIAISYNQLSKEQKQATTPLK